MADFLGGIDEFLAAFTPAERALSRALFRAILAGRPVPVAEAPALVDEGPAEAAAALDRLVARGSVTLDAGATAVVGARGLSLAETPHRLDIGGRRLHAFCAIDAVGIPVALGLDAAIASHCRGCRAPLALTVRGGEVIAAAGVVIWAAERRADRPLHAFT